MGLYTSLIRMLLFRLPPERAQKLAEVALGLPFWGAAGPFLSIDDSRLHCTMGGVPLPNPVGLAAGYDKDARLIRSLAHLRFGYIVVGTVVDAPRAGNPRPRLLREPAQGALINSLGFPSEGLSSVVRRLERRGNPRVPVIASISGLDVEEFACCYEALQPLVSGIELNISSPNTEGLRIFQDPENLEKLLSSLGAPKAVPVFVKLPPFFDDTQKTHIMQLVDVCRESAVDGVTASNTRPIEDPRLAVGRGGLSGRPLFPDTLRMVSEIRSHAGEDLTINACGGISSGEDAEAALRAGANTVQLFTGMVYQGPGLMAGINRHLIRSMARGGHSSLEELAAGQRSDQAR